MQSTATIGRATGPSVARLVVRSSGWRAAGLALVVLLAVGLSAFAARGSLGAAAPDARTSGGVERDAAREYRDHVAPDLLARKESIDATARDIDADIDLAAAGRADRYSGEVAPQIRAILADAEAYRAPTDRIAAVHGHAVAALRLAVQAADETTGSYRNGGDTTLLERARQHRDAETVQWRHWLDGMLALH